MKHVFYLFFVCLFFSCTTIRRPITFTKQWKGSDYPGHSEGKFENLNGEASFKLTSPLGEKFYLKYAIEPSSSGELSFIVRSGKDILYIQHIAGKSSDSILLDNKDTKKFQFALIGRKAAGSFTVDYGNVKLATN